jgi:O-antigen/teichoic acid export membrane protein
MLTPAISSAVPMKPLSGLTKPSFLLVGSMADQAFVSLTHFSANLLLAKWMTSHQYGAFAVAFAVLAVVFEAQNSLHLLPLAVLGTTQYRNHLQSYRHHLLRTHWAACLAYMLALMTAGWLCGDGDLKGSLVATAVSVPAILTLYLMRRICQIEDRQPLAAIASMVYLVLTGAVLLTLRLAGVLDAFSAILALGLSAAVGAALIALAGVSRRQTVDALAAGELTMMDVVRAHWEQARWALPSALATSGCAQSTVFLAGIWNGLAGAAAMRAAVTLVMPVGQFATALQTHFLPKLSRLNQEERCAWRKTGRKLSWLLVAVVSAYAVFAAFCSGWLYELIYGGRYQEASILMPVLALAAVPSAFSLVQQMMLVSAKMFRAQFEAAWIGAAVGLIGQLAGVFYWGLPGLALGTIFGSLASSIRARRSGIRGDL